MSKNYKVEIIFKETYEDDNLKIEDREDSETIALEMFYQQIKELRFGEFCQMCSINIKEIENE